MNRSVPFCGLENDNLGKNGRPVSKLCTIAPKTTKLEDIQTENQQAVIERKRDTDKELCSLVGGLQSLRTFVDKKMVTAVLEIIQRFNKLEAKILELMAAEI